jgi:ubiquinone/menaquinone biosynthesis C-methylase UbiE
MSEIESKVASHYGTGELHTRIFDQLRAKGVDPDALRPEDLKPVESLHVGGWQATEAVLALLGVERGARVLDIGCGIGGTARTAAVQHGATVTGIDLTPEFVAAAADLSRRAGVEGVSFVEGSATSLPFEDASFDLATMLHVGMNVSDKPALFREAARVLRPGGRFAVYDIMRIGPGELPFPMPWAVDPATSFVAAPEEYAAVARAAGFSEVRREERREGAVEGVEAQRALAAGTPMEARFTNLLDALRAGTVVPMVMILRREKGES